MLHILTAKSHNDSSHYHPLGVSCKQTVLFIFQREFEENRNAELVETQRLEEQERRRREEKVSQ